MSFWSRFVRWWSTVLGSATSAPVVLQPSQPPLPVPVTISPAATPKPPIIGITSMGYTAYIADPSLAPRNDLAECLAHPGLYAGAVINLRWSDLEPNQGNYDFSTIETGLTTILAYNAQHPNTPLRAKLRIDAGPNCPPWLLALVGSVTLTNTAATKHAQANLPPTVTYAAFWSAEYEAFWASLMTALAAKYDANPLIATICISSASSRTDEPFNIGPDPANAAALIAAGYTDAQWQTALNNAPSDYAAWKLTNIDFPFNPMLTLQSSPIADDTAMPIGLMQAFRQSFGPRAVLSNHGLKSPPGPGRNTAIIDAISKNRAPIAFQTDGPTLDLAACVTLAASLGCSEMEMWDSTAVPGGVASFTTADLAGWSAQIVANTK